MFPPSSLREISARFDEATLFSCLMALAGSWVFYLAISSTFEAIFSECPSVTPGILELVLRGQKATLKRANEAYNTYSKNGRAYKFFGNYIAPPSTFPEFRKVGKSVMSLGPAIDDSIYLKYFLGDDNTDVVSFTIQDITKNIPNNLAGIQEEVSLFWKTYMSHKNTTTKHQVGSDWFQIVAQPTILEGIGRISTRMLMNEKYSRNQQWTKNASSWASDVGTNGVLLSFIPEFLIPLACKLSPTQRRVKLARDLVRDDVYRFIDEPLEDKIPDPACGKEVNLLHNLVKYVQSCPDYQEASREKILKGVVGRMLGLIFAAIDTTTITTTQAIYDIICNSRKEYAVPLKQQINEVMQRYGGVWTEKALNELVLVDSFIKESQRLHPMSLIFGTRKVTKIGGHTFSSNSSSPNIHVPQGAIVMMPVTGVHLDPAVYDNPSVFDGFRHVKKADFGVPNDTFLSFGHGRHVCPGRWIALVTVKLMVIEFLTKYDWKEMQRPEDDLFGPSVSPNRSAVITLRRIAD